jgi:hypothetical protein
LGIKYQRVLTVIVFLYGLFDNCLALLFGLCHLVGLMVFGLILQKICVQNIKADYSDLKKNNSGNKAETKKLALISFLPQKVSLNILGESALIFLALVTSPTYFTKQNNIITNFIIQMKTLSMIIFSCISCQYFLLILMFLSVNFGELAGCNLFFLFGT